MEFSDEEVDEFAMRMCWRNVPEQQKQEIRLYAKGALELSVEFRDIVKWGREMHEGPEKGKGSIEGSTEDLG